MSDRAVDGVAAPAVSVQDTPLSHNARGAVKSVAVRFLPVLPIVHTPYYYNEVL